MKEMILLLEKRCVSWEPGSVKGTSFKVVKVAPLGDPVEINVRGYASMLWLDIRRGFCSKRFWGIVGVVTIVFVVFLDRKSVV